MLNLPPCGGFFHVYDKLQFDAGHSTGHFTLLNTPHPDGSLANFFERKRPAGRKLGRIEEDRDDCCRLRSRPKSTRPARASTAPCVLEHFKVDLLMRFTLPRLPFRLPLRTALAMALIFLPGVTMTTRAAALEDARSLYRSGQYQECIRVSQKAVADGEWDEEWNLLLVRSQLATGLYPDALTSIDKALSDHSRSIRTMILAREVFLQNGELERAKELLARMNYLGGNRRWAYTSAPDLVALGQAALFLGADPRRVLDLFFELAKKKDPKYRETYLASGNLALDKHDYHLASTFFQEGLKQFPDDPDLHYGLARAFEPSDRMQMVASLKAALDSNTNHVPSLLLLADHAIDSEDYPAARQLLDTALAINPWRPEAWAYRALLQHLANQDDAAAKSRASGLRFRQDNPLVDYLIGEKLSQKYRFAEAETFLRESLKFDPEYLPSKMQLAEALLRLGQEKEGWELATEVYHQDEYDVAAYNLVTLHDTLGKFQTLTNDHFLVRMLPHEADVYGDRVLELLDEARARLSEKYGLVPEDPTTVEIFPDQKDFAVRTFGLPHNPGFLGVCFGRVITANSPASAVGHEANWQSVLWHEFCHVITLQMTRNKMPRWLSEGISVYEEHQANPTWGQAMDPQYRELILNGKLTPISKLSGAFLSAQSNLDMQFAYYESSLVVEFLISHYGLDNLKAVLRDLADGTQINPAIEAHTAPLDTIEKEFKTFATQRAEALGPGLDWGHPKPGLLADRETWQKLHPNNYWSLLDKAHDLLEEKKYEEAKVPLKKLISAYPEQSGSDSAYRLLAAACRGLHETAEEQDALKRLATLSADATDAYLRLMELANEAQDWSAVVLNANRFLAVNPLIARPYRLLARAYEELDRVQPAIDTYRRLLLLNPANPGQAHYRLASLLHQTGDPGAKRQVLMALEESPRYRDAQRLLLQLVATPPEPVDR